MTTQGCIKHGTQGSKKRIQCYLFVDILIFNSEFLCTICAFVLFDKVVIFIYLQIVILRSCRSSAFKSIGELKETVQQLQADLTLANQKLKSVRQHSQVKKKEQ